MTLHLHNPRTPLLSGLATLDWLGVLTIVSAAVLLLVGLQEGSSTSYKFPLVITLLVLGSLLSVTFPATQWWQEKADGDPVLPLRIFKDISNLSALSVCACDALAFNSVAYFLPLYFQIVLDRSPTITGVYMLAVAVPLTVVSFASGFVMEKTGRFLEVLQAGLSIMTLGVGLLISLQVSDSIGKIIAILVVLGIGFGPNFGAPLIALQTRVRESDMATGTAAFGFVRMMFGAIGVVAGQVVFQLLITPHLDDFIGAGIAPEIANQLARGAAVSLTQTVAALPQEQRDVVRHGMTCALKGTWILYTVVSGLGFLVSFGINRTRLQREAVCESGVEMVDGERSGSSG